MTPFEIINPIFQSLVPSNAPLLILGEGYSWLEGPVWFGDGNQLLVSDLPNDRILRWTEDTGTSVFRQPSNFENGHTRDRQGRLIGCSNKLRCLTRTELDGTINILVERFQGLRLNGPNDVVVHSDGAIWFTDPLYGISTDYEGGKQVSELPPRVYRFDPETQKLTIVADDFEGPNGLCFSPNEKLLYVAESGPAFATNPTQHIRVFDVENEDRLANGRVFHKVSPGYSDGFRCDEDGRIWTSAGDGVHCVASDGTLLGKINGFPGIEFGLRRSQSIASFYLRVPYANGNLYQCTRCRAAMKALKILSVSRTVRNLAASEEFYTNALGFMRVRHPQAMDAALTGLFGARSGYALELKRGDQTLELAVFEPAGAAYPSSSRSNDAWFQHCALVTRNMSEDYARLRLYNCTPISTGGPVTLPGGIVAFKFRDADGHPLELIQFPEAKASTASGIDHAAIAVTDTERSILFYSSQLGFSLQARQRNTGPAQDALDNLRNTSVDVVALTPEHGSPHLELLGYRSPHGRVRPNMQPTDIAASRLVIKMDGIVGVPNAITCEGKIHMALTFDLDGHALLLTAGH